jgi:glutathione synthase/RimK-type ligase-like ATP-grasp enzyme
VAGPARVALATCAALPDLHEDDVLLLDALRARGADARPAVWDDPGVDWAAADLVVVRDTWDYVDRLPEFLAWAGRVPRLANPAAVLRWNTDKRYLTQLREAGVPVVPTTWLEPGERYAPPAGEHVVKPVVSAGARDTARYAAGEDSMPHVDRLLGQGRAVMVQPYLAAVDDDGETALLFVDGAFSHAARKAPVLAPGTGHPDDVAITPRLPAQEQRDVAQAALTAAAAAMRLAEPLLYARVDLLPTPSGPVVVELELAEPSLFLFTDSGAAERLADAVLRRAAG